MELTIKNIGKISSATIELNGITVIAGPNDSAKSTIGKVLFSVFNSFSNVDEKIRSDKAESISHSIVKNTNFFMPYLFRSRIGESLLGSLLENPDQYLSNPSILKKYLLNLIDEISLHKDINTDNIDIIVQDTMKILELPKERILEKIITKNINSEFDHQVNNIYAPEETAEISLIIRGQKATIELQENKVMSIKDGHYLNTEVIYIDDPYILDNIKKTSPHLLFNSIGHHKEHLQMKLLNDKQNHLNVIDDLLIEDRIKQIESKISEISDGSIVEMKGEYGYKRKNQEAVLSLKNISTGLKTFVIIKTLLMNGSLASNGTLILDEPEIHLHPKWQLSLAEIIVLIQKEFGMHILLNTHSPYFLRAIEVYSAKHGIADSCKYYLSENQGQLSTFKDVTNQIDIIYQKLASPLNDLMYEGEQID